MSQTSFPAAVVVPNYNYAAYLPARLASIRAQGGAVSRVIFMDDASTDGSVAVAEPILAGFSCPVTILRNRTNSGSVFRQWARGVEGLEEPFVWIAEADDEAEPGMLDALGRRLALDPGAAFAFSDSAWIDAGGRERETRVKEHASALGDRVLETDATLSGRDFVRRCLCPRNLVVNVSAVLWRTGALRGALERIGEAVGRWRSVGDWRIYAEAAIAGGTVHYDARRFNRHRQHARSVTTSTPRARYFAETVAMHAVLRNLLGHDPEADERMRAHLHALRQAWDLV